MTLKISCLVRSIGEYNEKFCSVIANGQVVSIISSAGASFHASSFPQLNCSAHICPFWWEMWRGSEVQLWQISDYSNGFCHSLGIRFSLESIYFVSRVCTCDSHEWGHSSAGIWHLRSRIGITMSWRVQEGTLASLVSPVSHLLRTTGPFTNRSVVCTCAISSWACCGRKEYVTGNLLGTESDWGKNIVYPAITT